MFLAIFSKLWWSFTKKQKKGEEVEDMDKGSFVNKKIKLAPRKIVS